MEVDLREKLSDDVTLDDIAALQWEEMNERGNRVTAVVVTSEQAASLYERLQEVVGFRFGTPSSKIWGAITVRVAKAPLPNRG